LIVGPPTVAEVGDGDVRTLVRKEVRDRATEATRTARYERCLAIELAQIERQSSPGRSAWPTGTGSPCRAGLLIGLV
jgi:hypothetical protein